MLPPLIAAMCRTDFYPHRPAAVQLVQTHISYVFLAGDQVYKVKKPVHFSFLDFSTPEQRRHFCHEEVRLNRRLAADVYLGVVGICRDGDAYRLGSEDDPNTVEYAVHMRRLPDAQMLDRRLRANQVTPELIDAIAHRVADFHQSAESGAEVIANGSTTAITRVLEDNFTAARPFRDTTIAARDDDAIQQFARTFLARHDELFRQRQAQHRIRDGHGDLRAEHICCLDGLAVIDCVEFNPRFRYCDVASDIAFLVMDLEDLGHALGHADYAARLIDTYVTHAGDPDLRRLLPFYCCYRAYVRGKVDSLTSVEEEISAEERESARRGAVRHFALAYRYTWAATPMLVVICGLSGSGKSAIAAALSKRTGFAHINSDIVRKQLAEAAPHVRSAAAYEAGLYTPDLTRRTYRALFDAAAQHLPAGRGVILDATFQRREDRDAVRAVAQQHAVPILMVECHCTEDEIRRRLAARTERKDSPSDADWNIYLEQRARYEPFAADERGDHLQLDGAEPVANGVARIEEELQQHRSPLPDGRGSG